VQPRLARVRAELRRNVAALPLRLPRLGIDASGAWRFPLKWSRGLASF